ncbi:uncharacterized protein LOC141907041 [Tubulanus polymorphus]|uniref:uncharacterized protein LOC141907041 n=1 Tax=Tubulanus polymorphus TaxID=672921 RepID=UPI003DA574FB
MAQSEGDMKIKSPIPSPGMCYDQNSHNGYDSGRSEAGDNQEAPLDFSINKPKKYDGLAVDSDSSSPMNFSTRTTESYAISNGSISDGERTTDSKSPQESPMQKIGEPKTGLPGLVPGMQLPGVIGGFPHGAGMLQVANALGTFQGIPPLIDPRKHPNEIYTVNKTTRPFKAYPKDPLSLPLGYYGIPGLTPFSVDSNTNVTAQQLAMTSEELFEQYRQQVLRSQDGSRKIRSIRNSTTAVVNNTNTTTSQSPNTSINSNNSAQPVSVATSTVPSSNSPTTSSSPNLDNSSPGIMSSSSRKRGRILPDDQKDEAYWERRRKNNEAAKRSRDSRRAKEDEIAIRAAFLEQENLKLRVEVAALKNETTKLKCMLYNS